MNLNATLIAQLVVFFILGWFTMKFVWPPLMKALDERAAKIAEGLAAADKAKTDLALAEKRAVEELRKAREEAAVMRTNAEQQAAKLIEEARTEAAQIINRICEISRLQGQRLGFSASINLTGAVHQSLTEANSGEKE